MKKRLAWFSGFVGFFIFLSSGTSYAEPSYYPSGPQMDVSLSSVLEAGWEICFQENYDAVGTPVASFVEACQGDYIMLTGAEIGSDTLNLLAAAPRNEVLTPTLSQETQFLNGTYWYFVPVREGDAHSIGFSGVSTVNIYTCDFDNESLSEEEEATKLCWHITDDGGEPFFEDGYRLGIENNPDVYSGDYLRIALVAKGAADPLFAQDARFNDIVENCRRDFTAEIRALVSPTIFEYQSCMFYDVTRENISRVNADVLAAYKASVTAGKPMNDSEIIIEAQKLALRYNVIDRLINKPETVYINDLVNIGLARLNNVSSRYRAINTLRALPANQKDTFEKLTSAVAGLK